MRTLTAIVMLGAVSAAGQQYDVSRHYIGTMHPLTEASPAPPEQIARQHLLSLAQELFLNRQDLEGIYLAKQYRSSHNGVTHLVFRQRFGGVDVWNAEWVTNLDRYGRVLDAGGTLYPAPQAGFHLPPHSRSVPAARSAVVVVNPELKESYIPVESREPSRRAMGIRFARGPLARDVEGKLVWHGQHGVLRPAWNFVVADTGFVHCYSVTVDDESQAILAMHPLTFFQDPAPPAKPRGLVFEQASPQPDPTPGVALTVPPPIVPRVMASFLGDPVASPLGWTDGTATAGNNTTTGENLAGADFVTPAPTAGVNGEFSFRLQLDAGFWPLNYPDAAVTNLFYWMNRVHDLHYHYGFDEQSGNFQANNFGRGGLDGDPIFAYAHFGADKPGTGLIDNSFFSLESGDDDGVPAEVGMFVAHGAGALNDVMTDGAYDSQVMVHEYTHGVSYRLARQLYTTFQGSSMGEGLSDFYGIEYTTPQGAPPDGVYPFSQYFGQIWGTGARSHPYSTNMSVNPLTYADLGHVISYPEVHADGEILVEALWEIRANLIAQFGEAEGRERIRQLIMDGMKLAIPAASMVDMRDATLLADRVDYQGASQSQLWAGFAKRGLGALAFSDGGDTVHALASFDLPSTEGQLKFYDYPIVIGEPVRVVLQDSNYTEPTVRVQLTTTSGDMENLILHRQGSIYEGILNTAPAAVQWLDNRLELSSSDQITATYLDADTGDGSSATIQTAIRTTMPYALNSVANAYTFSGERRVSVPTGSYVVLQLPFPFPFYDKTYGRAYVFENGLIAFELPATTAACADSVSLRKYHAIAPLWTARGATSLNGATQANEGLYVSTGPDSIAFRWAGEFTGISQSPSPTNYAATLFADGRIQFNYGSGNQTVNTAANSSECGPPVYGLGNGHDVYSQSFSAATYTNASTRHLDPPFGASSVPSATISAPADGGHVQDILVVSGTASDSQASVVALDVLIDSTNRAHLVPSGSPATWSTALDITSLGIGSGSHVLTVRVTNSRGTFADFPVAPLVFTVDPGTAFPPVVGIESPVNNTAIAGALMVKGYAYDTNLKISAVDTLIDGFVYGPTSYGATRSDICAPLTTQPVNCPKIGFSANIPTTANISTAQSSPPLADGPHTLQVRARDEAGRATLFPSTPLNITVQNGVSAPVIGVLESPTNNATVSGTVTVSGYVYSPGQTMATGLLLIDQAQSGAVRLGIPRPDVCAALPNADACPNIGFTVVLDTTQLQNGAHVVGVLGINRRGDYSIFPPQNLMGINIFVQNP